MLIGAPAWGFCSDKFGRKVAFLSAVVLTAVFGVASSFANSFGLLLVLRGLVGFGLSGKNFLQFRIFLNL